MGDDLPDLCKQFFAACEQGDLDSVQQIVDETDFNVSIDIDAGEGFTALQLAAGGGHENVVRFLLMKGAALDSCNSYGWTPLMHAASNGHGHIVSLLLQNKVDPNMQNKLGASALTLASLGGHLSVIRILLDYNGIDLNDGKHRNGQAVTPLMGSALYGFDTILKLLIDRGSDKFHRDPNTGWTSLMMAALGGHKSIAEMLVDNGADPNVEDVSDRTALEIATIEGKTKVKEYLERKTTNKNRIPSGPGKLKIIKATESGDEILVQRLLDEDPSQSNCVSKDGASPLMIAAMLGHRTIAETLVQRGADINRQETKSGWTALMQGTFHRRTEVVKYLIDAGADVSIQAKDGCKALDLALVIINNENNKSGDELIKLLASVTMPTTQEVKGQNGVNIGVKRTGSRISLSREDDSKLGWKSWWSRMSNRFRNLKLSRTFRLSSNKLVPLDDDDEIPGEKTIKVANLSTASLNHEDDGRHRRKSRDAKSVEFDLRSLRRNDSGFLETQSLNTMSIISPSFGRSEDKLLPVIPPFLPPPSFELQSPDRGTKSHHTSKSSKKSSSNQLSDSSVRNHRPNRLLFTRRSGGGVSPSNSLYHPSTVSPNSSGNSASLGQSLITAKRLNSIPSLTGKERIYRGLSGTGILEERMDSDPALAKFPSQQPRNASSTSSTISGSLPLDASNVRKKSSTSKGTGSTTSTLTPPPSPLQQSHKITKPAPKDEDPKFSSSSGISEEDEVTMLLKNLSLEKYAPIFEEQEVDMDAFLALNESDLEEMGIDRSGPRRQLMNAISQLNAGI